MSTNRPMKTYLVCFCYWFVIIISMYIDVVCIAIYEKVNTYFNVPAINLININTYILKNILINWYQIQAKNVVYKHKLCCRWTHTLSWWGYLVQLNTSRGMEIAWILKGCKCFCSKLVCYQSQTYCLSLSPYVANTQVCIICKDYNTDFSLVHTVWLYKQWVHVAIQWVKWRRK